MAWSYRDLVLLRLLAWLRQGRMERFTAAAKIESLRARLIEAVNIRRVHATRAEMILVTDDDEPVSDEGNSILPFDDFSQLMRTMDLHDAIREPRRQNADSIWAPDLVQPSSHTSIVPWVLSGEPCIRRSRIPAAAMFALFDERHLDVQSILALYPDVTAEAVNNSIQFETRLRWRRQIRQVVPELPLIVEPPFAAQDPDRYTLSWRLNPDSDENRQQGPWRLQSARNGS